MFGKTKMTKSKKHISEEDFLRYLENKMTDAERNAFERELQKHPFETEALEGFEAILSMNLKTDLQELKTRITHKKRNTKYRYWAAAATFLLLISSGIIWFQLKDNTPIPEMAETKTLQKEEIAVEEQKTDEPEIREKEIIQPELSAEKLSVNKSAPKTETEIIQITTQPTAEVDEMEIIISDSEIYDVQAKSKKESILNENIPRALNTQKSSSVQQINLEEEISDSFDNVQIEKKLMQAVPQKSSARKTVEILQDKKAQPEIGFNEFEKYIENEAVLAEDSKIENDTVEVVLIINIEGEITEILNNNQTDSLLFKRSVEIIKNGPLWNAEIKNGTPVESETSIILVFRKNL